MTSNQSERIDEILMSLSEYAAIKDINKFNSEQMKYEFPDLISSGEAKAAIEQMIVEEYKRGYTKGVIENSLNKDRLVAEARIDEIMRWIPRAEQYDVGLPAKMRNRIEQLKEGSDE